MSPDNVVFFSKPGTLAYRIELLVLDGYSNREIQGALGMPSHKVESTASSLRVKHWMSKPQPHKRANERKLVNERSAIAALILVPTAEIRRLHFERHVPLTHIAALLHVPYRAVSAAIG